MSAQATPSNDVQKVEIKGLPDFERWVVQESQRRPVVVDFWAPWCGPCKALGPMLEKAVADDKGSWLLATINTDDNQELAQRFGIRGIPAVKAFKNGKLIDEFMGVLPLPQLRLWLEQFVPSEADALVEAGRAKEAQSDWDGAREAYTQALELKPHHNQAHLGMARVEHAANNTDEVLRSLARVDPTDEEAAPEVARIRLELQSDEADDTSTLQQRLATDDNDHDARLALGVALSTQGQHEAALQHLLEVIRRDPERKDKAREAMVEIFDVLGFQHPLAQDYRARLAKELYR